MSDVQISAEDPFWNKRCSCCLHIRFTKSRKIEAGILLPVAGSDRNYFLNKDLRLHSFLLFVTFIPSSRLISAWAKMARFTTVGDSFVSGVGGKKAMRNSVVQTYRQAGLRAFTHLTPAFFFFFFFFFKFADFEKFLLFFLQTFCHPPVCVCVRVCVRVCGVYLNCC